MKTDSVIGKIKQTVNLKDLVKEYTEIKEDEKGYICLCPFPNHDDKKPSFHIQNDFWYCYGCNEGGDCIDFIQKMHPKEYPTCKDAIKYLANKYNIPISSDKNEKIYAQNKLLNNKYINDLDIEAINYLYRRGLSNKEIKEWCIGYDKSSNRIVFPLLDKYNNIIGYNKRLIKDIKGQPKYINSKTSDIFKKSQYLYGINKINNLTDYIIITEGVMDVILSSKYGLNNVVCTLGTSLTVNHIPVIKELNKNVLIIYDGDNKGIESTNKAAKLLLENNIYCKVAFLPKDKDLAEMALEYEYELLKYIESISCSYGYYIIKDIIDNYNKDLYGLRLKYQPILIESLNSIPNIEKTSLKSFIENEIRIRLGD